MGYPEDVLLSEKQIPFGDDKERGMTGEKATWFGRVVA
jgi:hypothetical protein